MLTVYKPRETDFSHNGLGVLPAAKAEVTEVLNGLFELALTCPCISGGRAWQYIEPDTVIKAGTPRGQQLFRVYRSVKKHRRNYNCQRPAHFLRQGV